LAGSVCGALSELVVRIMNAATRGSAPGERHYTPAILPR
jgi:hypothetical protein